jgi:hypothetical protein
VAGDDYGNTTVMGKKRILNRVDTIALALALRRWRVPRQLPPAGILAKTGRRGVARDSTVRGFALDSTDAVHCAKSPSARSGPLPSKLPVE